MQTRKIALHRNSLIAIVITLLVIGSALAIAGNSTAITPQKGTVSYQASYLGLPAKGATVTVSTLSGNQVATLGGALNQTSLPLGSYLFTMQPYVTYGASYIVNGTSKIVNVTSSNTQTISLDSTAYVTHEVAVTVNGAKSGAPATVKFSTKSGFVFETNTTTGTFNATLPTSGFFATVDFGGQINTTFITGLSASTITLGTTGPNLIGGYVTDSNGQPISNFNVIAINSTTPSYSIMSFTNGAFQFVKGSATNYVISANGYKPVDYKAGTTNYPLQKDSSNITYNYTLDNNPAYLNLTVDYAIGNSTAIPFMPNATVGSLYWQNQFDTFTSAASTAYLQSYVDGLVGNYTDYSILVNGHNYKQLGTTVDTAATATGNAMTAKVTFTFYNANVSASSLSNGFTVKLFTQGTQYNTGSLYYNYVFNYNIKGLSLSSPVSAANTFVNPVKLAPQATSGFLNLVFSKVSAPVVTASQINLYWKGTSPQNYLVTSNGTSAVFIVPTNTPVAFNLSKAFYNPVTNTNDYNKALNYTWKLNGTAVPNDYNEYNATITFGGFANYSVAVTYTSASGVTNTTNFNVFAYDAAPAAYLNVTSSGKTIFATAAVSGTQTLTVPQSKVVQFSGYYSTLMIPGTTYKVPLLYSWYFPGYTNNAVNVTQTFNTPYIANKAMVLGYLNVSTSAGSVASTQLSIKVNDTTAPSAQVTVQNVTHATIAQPIAGQVTIFSANKSTDKYYATSDLSYNWSIVYANGTKVLAGNSTYQLMGNNTNQSYLMVQFNTLNSLIVSLKVTNPSNVSSYSNFTTSMVVVSPRLVVLNSYFPTTPSQGAKTVVYLNISNNGTVNANSFYIVAIVNGKIVNNQSYGPLPVGTTKQFEFNFTSPSQGNVQVQFEAINSTQPAFFAKGGSLTITQKVSPPGYQTPLIVGGVIAIIIVIGVVYYRLSSRTVSKPKEKKQVPAKKTEEKKK